nr:hypothetical protein [Synechococcus sp. CS-1329]
MAYQCSQLIMSRTGRLKVLSKNGHKGACIQPETDETNPSSPASFQEISLTACWAASADIEIDASIAVEVQTGQHAINADIAQFGASIVIGATGIFAIQNQRPELASRHIFGHS